MLNCPDCLHFWYPNVGLERRASTKHALATAEILVTVGKRYFSKISSLKYRTTQYSKNLELVLGFSGFYSSFSSVVFSLLTQKAGARFMISYPVIFRTLFCRPCMLQN